MHYYIMNILDDDQNKLSLWENDRGKIYLEVGSTDNEDAPYYTGFITLNKDDAVALIKELTRLVGYVPTSQLKPEKSSINQKLTSDQPAQQLTLSKVNWGGK